MMKSNRSYPVCHPALNLCLTVLLSYPTDRPMYIFIIAVVHGTDIEKFVFIILRAAIKRIILNTNIHVFAHMFVRRQGRNHLLNFKIRLEGST